MITPCLDTVNSLSQTLRNVTWRAGLPETLRRTATLISAAGRRATASASGEQLLRRHPVFRFGAPLAGYRMLDSFLVSSTKSLVRSSTTLVLGHIIKRAFCKGLANFGVGKFIFSIGYCMAHIEAQLIPGIFFSSYVRFYAHV